MSSQPSSTAKTNDAQDSGEIKVPQPEDPEDARRMMEEEEEEERMDESVAGLSVPAEGPKPALIIVMGPASCGKSTVGLSLARALSIPFIDGDSLHPKSNVAKMSAGQPLTDAERLPWLALIRSTAERVCRESYVKEERAYLGVSNTVSPAGGPGGLGEVAEWEFGEGERWEQAETEGGGKKGEEAPGHLKANLGRPAVVIACSALKKYYRDILRGEIEAEPPHPGDLPRDQPDATTGAQAHKPATKRLETYFVYCKGSKQVLWDRISKRKNHFMKPQMLDSQLATLEDPTEEPGVCIVDITAPPEEETRQAVTGILKLAKV